VKEVGKTVERSSRNAQHRHRWVAVWCYP